MAARPRVSASKRFDARVKTLMPGGFTAQPLAALPLYGCGVPLAGTPPEQIKSIGNPHGALRRVGAADEAQTHNDKGAFHIPFLLTGGGKPPPYDSEP